MATIYRAELTPSKAEVLTTLVRERRWADPGAPLTLLGAYRFDDPAGRVGIETHIVLAGEQLVQIPLTYRDAPLAGADAALAGTMRHSVLGERWVYYGCADPVYVQALFATIHTGARGAVYEVHHDDGSREIRPSTVDVVGSGTPGAPVPVVGSVDCFGGSAATIVTGEWEAVVAHHLLLPLHGGGPTLTGTWAGSGAPRVLAYTCPRREHPDPRIAAAMRRAAPPR